jgi:hypothetical protein
MLDYQHTWTQRCAPLPSFWYVLGLPPGSLLKVIEMVWMGACFVFLLLTSFRARDPIGERLWYGCAMATLLIVTPIISKNYLIMLLLPYAAALQCGRELPRGDWLRRWLFWGIGISAFFLNVYNPWLVGDSLSKWMDVFQPAENCLVAAWVTLAVALTAACFRRA